MGKLLLGLFLIIGTITNAQEENVMKLNYTSMTFYSRNSDKWQETKHIKANIIVNILSPFDSYSYNYVKIKINDQKTMIYRVLTEFKVETGSNTTFRAINVDNVSGPMESSWFKLTNSADKFTVGGANEKVEFIE